jgi:hypothetical protein
MPAIIGRGEFGRWGMTPRRSAVIGSYHRIETAAFTKKQYEASSATAEKFFGAKSLDEKITIQTDFAKTAYEGFVA